MTNIIIQNFRYTHANVYNIGVPHIMTLITWHNKLNTGRLYVQHSDYKIFMFNIRVINLYFNNTYIILYIFFIEENKSRVFE